MSYTLKPHDEEEREERAAAHVREPISLKRIGFAVGIGSIVILSTAGLPSWGRERRPFPVSDGLAHSKSMLCHRELERACADLQDLVDPVTHQRPVYPTTQELFDRLLPIGHWQSAALFAADASVEELLSGGVMDGELITQRRYGLYHTSESSFLHWQLTLLDEAGQIVGRTFLTVPSLSVERCGNGDEAEFATYPLLEKRLPDWPRVAVFNRPAAEAQSDG